MRFLRFLGVSSALFLSAAVLQAQETNQLEVISQQLKQLQESQARFEQLVRDQQSQIEALKKQIASLETNAPSIAASTNPVSPVASAEDVDDLKQKVDELTKISKRPSVNQFNPGIGVAIDTIYSYTSKSEQSAGLDRPGGFDAFLRTVELNLEATVDPFAKAYGVISGSADARTGDANLEVEEASVVTTSLPWNLTAQGGRFFAEFGRLSYVHDHDLPFVYRPLVLNSYIGGESRSDGFQVNYLLPTEHYVSLTTGLGNGFGADTGPTPTHGYRSLSGINYWGRLSSYFDLTPSLNLEAGISGLADERAEGLADAPTQRDRYIAGTDLTLRYQPLGSTVYQGYVWGTEALYNSANFEKDPGLFEREHSFGLYSYLEKKLNRQFKIGFLFDWFEEPSNSDAQTFRYSPYITWNPSEFQLLRLQYSHTAPDSATGLQSSDAIYLQWSAIIGRHVHGFKQR